MAYSGYVSKTQIIDLLGKLADDDGYRSRFERSPETALAELNFVPGSFSGFPGSRTNSSMLADKTVFATARKRMVDEVAGECLCMIIPSFRLDFGNQNQSVSAAMR